MSKVNNDFKSFESLKSRLLALENENKFLKKSLLEINSIKNQRRLLLILIIIMIIILIIHRISTPFKMFFSIYEFHKVRWDCGIYFYYVKEPVLF